MSALTAPAAAALANLKSWAERILAEPATDSRLKATLLAESLDRYGIASATLARVLGADPAGLATFLATRIAPGETFYMDAEGGTLAAPYLAFAKVRRQLEAEKSAFQLVYRGAMDDNWLTARLAVMLAQNGIADILDFAVRNVIVTVPAGAQLLREYRNLGDATEWTGQYLYPINVDQTDYEHPRSFVVPRDLVSEGMIEGNWAGFLRSEQVIDTGVVDYYFNKSTNQRLDYFSDQRGDVIAIEPTGDGTTLFRVKFTAENIPVFFSQKAYNESILEQFIPVLGILAMAATAGGASGWIGGSILGAETAAAFPVVADALGRMVIATVATGGDVAGAATKFASTLAGGYFGDVIGTGLDSAAIGAVSQAVIESAINGGDVRMAALQSLATLGIAKMDDWMDDFPIDAGVIDAGTIDIGTSFDDMIGLADLGIDPDTFVFSDWMTGNEEFLFDQGISLDSLAVDTSGNLFLADGQFVELAPDVYGASYYVDSDGNIRAPNNALVIDASDASQMSEQDLATAIYSDWNSNQETLTNSMEAAPGRPDSIPPPADRTKVPGIVDYAKAFETVLGVAVRAYTQIRAVSNGTYRPPTTAYPNGIPRVQAVGVPVVQADGSTITNNGNGTQTIRRADGSTDVVRTAYTGASGSLFGGISNQTLMIGGAVLLGALILSKRGARA